MLYLKIIPLKNFNRPEWIKLLSRIKQRGNKTNIILFTKWDRFGRDAYQMISMLTKSGVEPQAIEQPLDLSIPENKMMLSLITGRIKKHAIGMLESIKQVMIR